MSNVDLEHEFNLYIIFNYLPTKFPYYTRSFHHTNADVERLYSYTREQIHVKEITSSDGITSLCYFLRSFRRPCYDLSFLLVTTSLSFTRSKQQTKKNKDIRQK